MSGITFDMSGRTALVTGASSGIGRYLCLELAASGARVVAAARRGELLQTLVDEIAANGGKAVAATMDVADAGSVAAAYDVAEEAFGTVDNIAYCSSKAAAIMAGRIMALEWAQAGINVNTVCPGALVTEISAWFYETEEGRKRLARYPRNRLMQVEDIMTPLLYLGSDQSRTVTGPVVVIDDGQTLG